MQQIDREPDVSTEEEEEEAIDENGPEDGNGHSNSICIRFDFTERRKAEIIFNSLSVDKEPKRSRTKRELLMEGSVIVAKFSSDDQKSLMRSASNFADMCLLARNCIDTVGTYTYKPNKEVKTRKEGEKGKKKERAREKKERRREERREAKTADAQI